MVYMLLASSAVVSLLAHGLLAHLWPRLGRGRPRNLFWGAAFVCLAGWLALRGLGGPATQVARALIGTWTVACLIVLVAGLPVLLVRLLRRLFLLPPAPVHAGPGDPSRREVLAGLALPAV